MGSESTLARLNREHQERMRRFYPQIKPPIHETPEQVRIALPELCGTIGAVFYSLPSDAVYSLPSEPVEEQAPAVARILGAVCSLYCVSVNDIKGNRRTAHLVRPRQIAMYLAATYSRRSTPEIGRFLGGKDHTTVLHARDKIAELLKTDASIVSHIDTLKHAIGIA